MPTHVSAGISGNKSLPDPIPYPCFQKQLTGRVIVRSHERLGFWLSLECSMMKSSMLFEGGPLPRMSTSHPPDVMYVIGVPRPSCLSPLFSFHVLYRTQTKEQKRGRPGNKGIAVVLLKLTALGDLHCIRYASSKITLQCGNNLHKCSSGMHRQRFRRPK